MRTLLFIMGALICGSILAADPIDKVEETYAKQLKRVIEDYEKKVSRLNEGAVRKLESLRQTYMKTGDHEKYEKAKAAIKKYEKGVAVKSGGDRILGDWKHGSLKIATFKKDGTMPTAAPHPNGPFTWKHLGGNLYAHTTSNHYEYLLTLSDDGNTLWLGKIVWATRVKK